MADLKTVLQSLSAQQTLAEHRIMLAVGRLDKAAPQVTEEHIIFSLSANEGLDHPHWGTYFGPGSILEQADGTRFEVPGLQQITPETIAYWKSRAGAASHPVMKARYADAVWDLAKKAAGTKPDVEFARTAIDAYLDAVENQRYAYRVAAVTYLKRTLSLALAINDTDRIDKAKQCIIAFDTESEDSSPGCWGFGLELLDGNPRAGLTEPERKRLIAMLEERLQRLNQSPTSSMTGAEHAATVLARHHRKAGRPDDVARVLDLYLHAVEIESLHGNGLQKLHWLQKAQVILEQFGLNAKANALRPKIRDAGRQSIGEMRPIDVSLSVPEDEMNAYISQVLEGDLDTALQRLCVHFVPRRGDVEAQLRDLAAKAPLQFLMDMTLVEADGRPVATIGPLDDDLEGRICRQISQNMDFESVFLERAIDACVKKFEVDPERLLDWLSLSPCFDGQLVPLLSHGLQAYFGNDMIAALHILTPQIEIGIRTLVAKVGGAVLEPNRHGGLQYRSLNGLLNDKVLEQVFPEDVRSYFRVTFTEQRGWNLRNNICHGLQPATGFTRVQGDRVLHGLLCLGMVRPRREQEQSPKTAD